MDKIIESLKNIQSEVDISLQAIRRAEGVIRNAEAAILESKNQLTELKDRQTADAAFSISLQETLDEASNILQQEIQDATSVAEEFSYPEFKAPLLAVAENMDLYSYTIHGVGWRKNINIQLDMNGIAGDISNYAAAVENAREALGIEQRDPVKASEVWRKNIFPSRGDSGLYEKTISLRKAYFGSPAPFWSLLSDGNAGAVSMASDWGGSPYPRNKPTRFVDKAETKIYKFFRDAFITRRNNNTEAKRYLKTIIAEYERNVDLAYEKIGQMSDDYSRAKILAKELGIPVSKLDLKKLLDAKTAVESGTQQKTFTIGPGGRRVSAERLSGIDY